MKNEDDGRRRRRRGLECAVERRGSKTQSIRRYLVGAQRKAREAELASLVGPGDPSLAGGRVFHANGGAWNRDAAIRLNYTSDRDVGDRERRLRGDILPGSLGRGDGE